MILFYLLYIASVVSKVLSVVAINMALFQAWQQLAVRHWEALSAVHYGSYRFSYL